MKYANHAESKSTLSARLAEDNLNPCLNALTVVPLFLDRIRVSSDPVSSFSCSSSTSSSRVTCADRFGAHPSLSGGSIRGSGGRGLEFGGQSLDSRCSLSFNFDPVLEAE